ncbi:hypothetical protein OG206_31195 [Streptomyces sp. NBC_01341]|uniref:hypothetical protein n=1 Tax=Streptomyces sp. NBC_01341 TaxID=2903831 RepID=UPI002E0FDE6E|nr:hypothetical protein OG206_31195 [Streptomyces sp. NBC_01341]
MTRLHRASCPGLRTFVLAGFAVAVLAVPAQAAAGAPATPPTATGTASAPVARSLPGGASDHVRPPAPPGPPVHGRGRHDFGWQ